MLLVINMSHAYTYQAKSEPVLQALINPPYYSPNENTWLGADVASSVELTPGRYLWLFGDTLLGAVFEKSRVFRTIIPNSIGISKCHFSPVACQIIQPYVKTNGGFFDLKKNSEFFWPIAGSMLKKKLFLSGYAIKKNKDADQWINIANTQFVLVDNPMEIPLNWKYHFYSVPYTNAKLNWATAIVKHDKWLYIFGSRQLKLNDTNTVLARILIHEAEVAHWNKMEYWLGGNQWTNNMPSSKSLGKVVGLLGLTEMSVDYNDLFGWYTIQIPFLSSAVHFYTAKELSGPWVDQGILYTIPNLLNSSDKMSVTNHFFDYAAKVHPELATNKKEVVFTYNINQWERNAFINNLKKRCFWSLYIPQFVVVQVNSDERKK